MFVTKRTINIASKVKKSSTDTGKIQSSPKKKKPVSSKTLKSIIFVLPLGNGWVVKNEKAARFMVITDSKREAISIARNVARTKKTRLVVHGKSGLIELKENYIA